MKLTLLGTGNAFVTECYNTCFVIEDENKYFMVDGGGGNQIFSRLKDGGFDWKNMRDIFVTHKHLDHIMGIIWMVRLIGQNMSQGTYEGEANIYAHEEVIGLLRTICNALLASKHAAQIDKRLHLIEVHDGDELEIIGHKVTFFDIQSTKAKQYGFTMDLGNGEKLTCCGDEPYRECEHDYVKDSKWLLHEAFCLYEQRDIFHPYEKSHSTVKDACEMAEEMGVENLILYHTEEKNLANRKELYYAEGKPYYSGHLLIPDDMEVVEL